MTTDDQRCEIAPGQAIAYREQGPRDAPTVLLVAGLGQQLLSWPQGLCDALGERGLRVVRFDNRDVGRSFQSDAPVPALPRIATRRFDPRQYSIDDMALDAARLVDALGIAPVHVVGQSMGGMISQNLAARHPDRVASLTSISSMTGRRRAGRTAPSTLARMFSPPARTREAFAERMVTLFRHVGSHGFPYDEATIRTLAEESWDRGPERADRGVSRQLGAILKSGDRTRVLGAIRAPTLVIHGDRDRMVHPSGGRATADAIPGARLETIRGLGHDLPELAWPQLVDLIHGHVRAAAAASEASRREAGSAGRGA